MSGGDFAHSLHTKNGKIFKIRQSNTTTKNNKGSVKNRAVSAVNLEIKHKKKELTNCKFLNLVGRGIKNNANLLSVFEQNAGVLSSMIYKQRFF